MVNWIGPDPSLRTDFQAKEIEQLNQGLGGGKKLLKVILWAFLSALVVAGVALGVYFWWPLRKVPDLVLMAPSGEDKVVVNASKPIDMTYSVSTVGGILADRAYKDETDGYSIKAPAGWIVDSTRKTGASVVFLSPETQSLNKNVIATFISVTVAKVENTRLSDQIRLIKENILTSYPSFAIEDDKDFYLQGRIFHLISGYYVTDGIRVRNRSMVIIYKDKGYAVSATGPDSKWLQNEINIVTSMNSFQLL